MPGGVAGAQSIMVAPYADLRRLELSGSRSVAGARSQPRV
jgi:hypothetical protein